MPDIEGAVRISLGESVEARAGRHGRRDGDDAVVLLRFLDEVIAEHLGVGGRDRLRLVLLAGGDIEFHNAVIFVVRGLGRRVALALLRAHVHEDRAFRGVADIFEYGDQLIEVMAVHHAYVIEAQFLEQSAAGYEAARQFFSAQGAFLDESRQPLGDLLANAAQRHVRRARQQARKISRHRADRRRDRHFVVVKDHDQAAAHGAGIVHRFVGHARRDRAIADDADDVVVFAGEIARDRHTQSGRDRGRGMRRAEAVVFAFRALSKSGQASALPQCSDPVPPSGQDLVRVGLMADVPDQLVCGRIEDIMQRNREFDNAETGAEMAAGHCDGADGLSPQFVCNLLKVPSIDTTQISRTLEGIENRPGWLVGVKN
jgi:hypothetical protein